MRQDVDVHENNADFTIKNNTYWKCVLTNKI